MIGLVVFLIWLVAWYVLSGAYDRTVAWVHETTITQSRDAGLQLQNILIEGRVNADPQKLKELINMEKGDPLLSFDPVKVQQDIQSLSWVKRAQVERRLPDTVYVRIEERVPYALMQEDGKVAVIDREGVTLTRAMKPEYEALMLVTGDKAAEHAAGLVDLLKAEPVVMERTEAAFFVSGRRWDLRLKNGMAVNLPAGDVGLALRRLADAIEQDGILDKDIKSIDLREDDRIIVEGR